MRLFAFIACSLAFAFTAGCVSPSSDRPAMTRAGSLSERGPERMAEISVRLSQALAGACSCREAPEGAPPSLRLCGYPIRVETAAVLQASTNGHQIHITTGMLDFLEQDDELAFVLAHELAHILLGHNGAFEGQSRRGVEAEADRLGIRIVSKAKYDTAVATDLPLRLARAYPDTRRRYGAYGSPELRKTAIAAALRDDSSYRLLEDLGNSCQGRNEV